MTKKITSLTGLRVLAAAGAAIFAVSAAVLFLRPDLVERRAQEWVVEQAVQGAAAALGSADNLTGSVLLQGLSGRFSGHADSLRMITEARLAAQLAKRLESVCHYCPSTTATERSAVSSDQSRQMTFEGASQALTAWALGRYSATVRALIRDLRIFATINAAIFVLVFAASFQAGADRRQVPRVPLWLLLATPLVGTAGYVFAQNWFYTLLTGRFIGFGYALWVVAIFLVLLDWVVNRARASQAIADIIGGAFNAAS